MSDTYSQGCPIAIALDVIGDRWMLLLLRDLAHAPMRFTDLQAINPKISPNLLSKRLRQLQDAGLAAKRELPPPAAATVYELRPEARDAVLPVLNALGRFGAHLFQAAPAAAVDALLEQMRRNGHWVLAKGIDFEAAFRFKLHPHDFGLTVGPTVFEPTRQPPERPTATIESEPGHSHPAVQRRPHPWRSGGTGPAPDHRRPDRRHHPPGPAQPRTPAAVTTRPQAATPRGWRLTRTGHLPLGTAAAAAGLPAARGSAAQARPQSSSRPAGKTRARPMPRR